MEKCKYIFIGEKRSQKAIAMGVKWKDGKLAAKQLFDALLANEINPKDHYFINLFKDGDELEINPYSKRKIKKVISSGIIAVALGNLVSCTLYAEKIPHLCLIHPAARGKIRKKERYINHVKKVLGNV